IHVVAGPFCLCVAGPNGSGKTTLAGTLRSRFPPLPWIDPDEIEVELRQDQRGMPADQDLLQRLAFRAARNRRVDYAVRMRDFGFETVFSHGSNLAFLRALRAIGYEIHLVFVATDNVELNVRRVETRVHMGGHHV